VTPDWELWLVVASTILAGIFSKGGSGAVYAMVPLIQRRMTGQIAGMVGAFGNVGGLAFLTVLSFVPSNIFFMTIAGTAAFVFILIIVFLKEPEGHMVEVLEDGTVEIIEVK
jgi:NNP family nitrate/nitrite transporter-like MFS transporter